MGSCEQTGISKLHDNPIMNASSVALVGWYRHWDNTQTAPRDGSVGRSTEEFAFVQRTTQPSPIRIGPPARRCPRKPIRSADGAVTIFFCEPPGESLASASDYDRPRSLSVSCPPASQSRPPGSRSRSWRRCHASSWPLTRPRLMWSGPLMGSRRLLLTARAGVRTPALSARR